MKTKNENLSLIRVCILSSVILALCAVQLTSCSDDDPGPDDRTKFLGKYDVEESPSDGADPDEFYEITISNSGSGIEIDNFRFFLVPIKATVNGMNMTIPSQSFTQGSATIEVSGSGVLADDVLYYDYTLTGFVNTTKFCYAVKK
jgi:hypothetical protein